MTKQANLPLERSKSFLKGVALTTVLGSMFGLAVNLPHSFRNGQPITAQQLNGNFNALKNAVDALEGGQGSASGVDVPLILTGSGIRIPNATLQAYNDAGGIGAVIGSSRAGTSDAALVLGQSGTGPLLKGFGANGGEHEIEVASNGTLTLLAPNLQANIRLDNASGVVTARGFNSVSDRNVKTNFSSVSALQVLEKVSTLPITRWNYRADAKSVQHIGPMAQDFEAAFGLNGGDGQHINTVDAQGVTLAAIQGLNAKLEQKDAQIKALEGKLSALEARLKALENK